MSANRQDKLTEAELELISAFVDDELTGEIAARVARRIEHDPLWQRQADQLRQLDDVLGAWPAEKVNADFTRHLSQRLHRRRPSTYIKWLAPLATAACITIVTGISLINNRDTATPTAQEKTVEQLLAAMPQQDRFVIENLDWLKDYQLLAEFETIEAAEALATAAQSAKAAASEAPATTAAATKAPQRHFATAPASVQSPAPAILLGWQLP